MREQALRLASTTSAPEARRLSTELATACSDCHMVNARSARFQTPPEPAEDGSLRGAMAHHRWAAETMWIGLVAPSTDLWREGLEAMTARPVPSSAFQRQEREADIERLRRRLIALASRSGRLPGQGDRSRRLAEIMDVCAACHAIARR
jgi:cytochrome c553